ncbi:flavin reductase family protein [Acidilobus sp.]|uniref:flavin reductase family protein n=1 Tax=Acidilobus sp. TaxID=1872109 RepID=UPI003D050793
MQALDAGELIKQFMRSAAQQVYVVTARDLGGSYAALTVSSMTSLSISPPLILICIDRSSRSHEVLTQAPYFIVTMLSKDDEWLSRLMDEPGDALEKLRRANYMESKYGPMLPGDRPYLVARRWAVYDGGDRSIIVGEVVDGSAPPMRCPLLYQNRAYTTVKGC